MKAIFLGTGTSNGVPQIGCGCKVCVSENPKNKRFRSSLLIKSEDAQIAIDTPPEFRLQCLRENIKSLDGVFFTHAHADHIFGLDDLRAFTEITGKAMPVYANSYTSDVIKNTFSYVFKPAVNNSPLPKIDLTEISPNEKREVKSIKITPIEVKHGNLNILSYKINNFLYCTDCNHIPEESEEYFHNLDTLVLGALRYTHHSTHFNVEESLEVIEKFNPKKAYLTHMTHHIDHENIKLTLPDHVSLAYDGLEIEI